MALCTEQVDRGTSRWSNFQPCGREAVEDGLCKLHLRVRDRRRKRDEDFAERRVRADYLREEAARLTKILGLAVPIQPHFNSISRPPDYDGRMVVPLSFLQAIAHETSAEVEQ